MRLTALSYVLFILTFAIHAEDQLAVVKLIDGRTLLCVTQTSHFVGNDEMLSVVTVDGEKVGFKKAAIVSSTMQDISTLKLTDAQKAVCDRERRKRGDAATRLNTISAAEKRVSALKRAENDAVAESRKADTALKALQEEQQKIDAFVESYPVTVAKMDARYDAAKAEIASGSSYSGAGNNPTFTGRQRISNAPALRKEMEELAASKVNLTKQYEMAKTRQAELKTKVALAAEYSKTLHEKVEQAKSASNKAVLDVIELKK